MQMPEMDLNSSTDLAQCSAACEYVVSQISRIIDTFALAKVD